MKKRNVILDKPLVFLDLETTGVNIAKDRIVEIGMHKVLPNKKTAEFRSLVNPGVQIPPEATKVHGITNEKVENEPKFEAIAARVREFIQGCDLAGFNIRRFDLPLLEREFDRAGIPFEVSQVVVDSMTIFHEKEKRDLTGAYRFYCNEDHTGAHSALSDAKVCWKILEAQVLRYEDLPSSIANLAQYCGPASRGYVDSGEWFRVGDDGPVFAKGKHRGSTLQEVNSEHPDYLNWMLSLDDLRPDTAKLIRSALSG